MQKNQQWKIKVQELFQVAQDELKKTTEIGKKMLSASKTNSSLHEAYEELGMLTAKALEKGTVQWENARVKDLLAQIKSCEKDLEVIEKEVKRIKVSPSPVDISAAKTKPEAKSEQEGDKPEEKKTEEKKSEES